MNYHIELDFKGESKKGSITMDSRKNLTGQIEYNNALGLICTDQKAIYFFVYHSPDQIGFLAREGISRELFSFNVETVVHGEHTGELSVIPDID